MTSVNIYSRRMVLPDGMREATLTIDNGRISGVTEGLVVREGAELVDAGEKIVMAGLIDPHVHINEPGRTDWEGFDTATRAAIAGGISMLVEMPLNASPVTTTALAFQQKLDAASGKLYCHCGFWGGVIPGNAREIQPLIDKGVLGFKAFLTHSGIDEFPNITEAGLREAMPVIARSGLPLLVHCELESPVEIFLESRDPRSYRQWLESRPRKWENNAIALMIRLCEEYGCRTHVVHLSSSDAIPAIREAKRRGLPLTVETAQHYLFFCAEEIADGLPAYKCAPPIREKENNGMLWEALEEGLIDFVATDHSPAPPAMKQLESGDLQQAWGGIASLQLALPALWTRARERGVGPERMADWLSREPAKLAGQQHHRGTIAAGHIADLVVWDPDRSFTVDAEGLYHRHKVSPYQGRELYGVVEQTWIGGVKVFDGGVFADSREGRIILNTNHA